MSVNLNPKSEYLTYAKASVGKRNSCLRRQAKQIHVSNIKCSKQLSKVLNLKNWKLNIISYFVFRISILSLLICFILVMVTLFKPGSIYAVTSYWSIQSIDTMKYSRDLAREGADNPLFEKVIQMQVQKIKDVGATHVAIGTPYDQEFNPYLKMWVDAVRKNNLNVWFRGNFSGWEGWFNYAKISKEEHLRLTEEYILGNSALFEDEDIFTPCTECENGQIGDPRDTKDVSGFRSFLIDEYEVADEAFKMIGKKVRVGYFSMNADVARLVMDEETTDKLGGIVVIDHYVKEPEKLAQDVKEIGETSGGQVVLGEFGVPIPDINGTMSEEEQSEWIEEALRYLSKEPALLGVNYWVSFGGTTAIWNNDGSARDGALVLHEYLSPKVLSGRVVNELGKCVVNAMIIADTKQAYTNEEGNFEIVVSPSLEKMIINSRTYKEKEINIDEINGNELVLEKEKEGLFFKYYKWVYSLAKKVKEKWFD